MKQSYFLSFRTLTFMLLTLGFVSGVQAQAPEGFSYQAVVRDGAGALQNNQLIQLQFTIRTGSATGSVQYKETATSTSDAFAMITHMIGTGTPVTGTFAAINWSSGNKFLETEINLGSGFVSMGTQQLYSVPYALEANHAANADNATNATNATNAVNATNATNATNAATATTSSDNRWSLTGNAIHNNNNGFVGINTSTPGDRFTVYDGNVILRSPAGGNTDRGIVGIGSSAPAWTNSWGGFASFNTGGDDQADVRFYTTYGSLGMRMRIRETGPVEVVGNLSKGGGSFKIDHPVDPANKYLYHSFVESPDMMNVYNGNATTDANGYATVTLPDYFEALNRDFRYQLTPIGGFAQVWVEDKVSGNQFVVRSNTPNQEISWQVTGVRQDAFANKNRIPNAVEKTGDEKGKYLHPEAFDLPMEMALPYLIPPTTGKDKEQK